MKSRLLRTFSIVLVLSLLINLCPAQALASTRQTETTSTSAIPNQNQTLTNSDAGELDLGNVAILAEVVENRTEFSKEYKLTNGLNMKVVYPESVHYAENGQWKDIDNTLKLVGSGSSAMYTNTADSWQVSFPRNLNQDARVTVSSGGYTIHFRMAGALKKSNNISTGTLQLNGEQGSIAVQAFAAQDTVGQTYMFDYSEEKAQAKYPEAVRDKLRSRMTYSGVYDNTSVIYDFTTQQLKESIVIAQYDANLIGYRYVLNTGSLVPFLNDDGSIVLLSPETKEIILTMPAPYMIDDVGAVSYDVTVTLEQVANEYVLTYQMPMQWLADSARAWPVVLDPIVERQGNYNNISDVTLKETGSASYKYVSIKCGRTASEGAFRAYVQFDDLPELPYAATVVDASIALFRPSGCTNNGVVEVHEILEAWESSTVTWSTKPDYNTVIADYASIQNEDKNYWNITNIVQKWYETGVQNGVVFKVPDAAETATTSNYCEFWSSDCGAPSLCPTLYVVFRDSNGLESYWDYTSASAGRAGTGYVNNYTGNLTWVRSDLGFSGNRMPVSISHIYNSNDCDTNNFGLGYGWKTNYNQFVARWTNSSNTSQSYYYWEDGDGTRHYFVTDSEGKYVDEDGLELTLTINSNGTYTIMDKVGNTSNFDSSGRLTSMVNNQATKSSISITYTSTTSKNISKITDGAGRKYNFTYSNGLLSKITYTGSGTTEVTSVTYGYSGSNLITITDKDSGVSTFGYSSHLLTSATDVDGYKLQYTYSAGDQKRVTGIAEYDGTVAGSSLTIAYGNNETRFTDHNSHTQILQFNDWGNVTSVQDDQGRALFSEYTMNDHDETGGKGNQLTVSSKLQNTIGNRTRDSSFEFSDHWPAIDSFVTTSRTTEKAYIGKYSLKMVRATAGAESGIRCTNVQINPHSTYTLSGYVKTGTGSVRLAINDGSTTVYSDYLPANSDWTRLQVSYTNNSSTTKTINLRLVTSEAGTTYLDAVQLEYAATASRYNLVTHNDFRSGGSPAYAWTGSGLTSDDKLAAAPSAAAPELEATAFCIVGSPTAAKRLSQTVNVTGSAGDAYVLAGWAMADSAPLTDENRTFALKAEFQYTDGTDSEPFIISFNPGIDSSSWQYAADAIVAEGAYNAITVTLDYSYNVNSAYFDGIQLFREEFGSSYTYDDDGNVTSVTDLQKQVTDYEYNTAGDLTKILQNNKAKMTYEYDNYHNVIKATSSTGVVYEFTYDAYGNNTSVSIVNGTNKITSTATYSTNGNQLVSTTDALGNTTTYQYNANTGVLEWVRYPKDTASTQTEYTYDTMYRLASAAAYVSTGKTMSASYTYAEDLLTQITTGSTTYTFNYGDFAQTSSIQIGSRTLAAYSYTNDKNRYLEKLDYGNNDSVQYTYDDYGRVVKETFEDGDTVTYEYDNSGALAIVTDSATGRKTTYYYDLTDRMMKYVESSAGFSHSVGYEYDTLNNLTKLVETINGVKHQTTYTYDDDNRLTTMVQDGVTSQYSYDAYGRLTVQTANATTRTYIYNSKDDGTPTGQVKRIVQMMTSQKFGGTFNYSYDGNGNILVYDDEMISRPYSYAYDSANQLIRENNGRLNRTWVWEYDGAGNILSRTEYAYTTGDLGTANSTITYTYGDSSWGDLLTAYNGKAITYDGIGNLLTYNGWTYAWEHGRELASMTKSTTTWTYTYDANGMRTSRSNGTTTYTYVYNGNQLVQMSDGTNVLYFTYDANGHPLTVTMNGTLYYYITNMQGDVVAIWTPAQTFVCEYIYDAWGKLQRTITYNDDPIINLNPLLYRGYVYDRETSLYYLQSRYYNPEWGRFINLDGYLTTEQGLLSNNLFAYCLNNPVCRKDNSGTTSVEIFDSDGNPLTDDDERIDGGKMSNGNSGNGSFWQSFTRSLSDAANGLKMASGQRNPGHIERHHVLSNKNKIYTPQFKEITDRYNMFLDTPENIISLPGHQGRHTTAYHDFMLSNLQLLDTIAAGSQATFTEGFKIIKEFLGANPWLPYAK